ncbi:hypothetical protein UPYG_G00240620 [Umbra pygmaea]|uniref:C2H2-type domain-containing protein n=1 Tax=Umbra pygmaea TaxID=75934 RepID=A0ABD0WK96_UMBPY
MDHTLTCSVPHLPLSSIRLLVPPLRLMSASMWQLAQQRDVMHYGKLEEFVTLVTEMVPELLTFRQKAQLVLGLRARLVLEVLHGVESNPAGYKTIQPHLERIYSFAICKHSKDQAVKASQKAIVDLVQNLLEDPAKKEHFFQEVFPVHYSSRYDTALQILVFQFFDRLEELLPVPSFAQTASYLSLTPTGLEECQQSVWDPEHLNTLLQHHRSMGLVKKDLFFYDSDIILSTLSLPVPSLMSKRTPRGQEKGHVESESDVRVKEEITISEGPQEQEGEEDEGRKETTGEDEVTSQQGVEDTDRLEEAGDSGQPSGDSSDLFFYDSDIILSTLSLPVPSLTSKLTPKGQEKGQVESGSDVRVEGPQEQEGEEDEGPQKTSGEDEDTDRLEEAGDSGQPSGDSSGPATAKPLQPQGFYCCLCQFSGKWTSLQEHFRKNHLQEGGSILGSGEPGANNNSLSVRETENPSAKKPRKKRYTCSLCGSGFVSPCDLKRHESVHSEDKPFHCDKCEKRYMSS